MNKTNKTFFLKNIAIYSNSKNQISIRDFIFFYAPWYVFILCFFFSYPTMHKPVTTVINNTYKWEKNSENFDEDELYTAVVRAADKNDLHTPIGHAWSIQFYKYLNKK